MIIVSEALEEGVSRSFKGRKRVPRCWFPSGYEGRSHNKDRTGPGCRGLLTPSGEV